MITASPTVGSTASSDACARRRGRCTRTAAARIASIRGTRPSPRVRARRLPQLAAHAARGFGRQRAERIERLERRPRVVVARRGRSAVRTSSGTGIAPSASGPAENAASAAIFRGPRRRGRPASSGRSWSARKMFSSRRDRLELNLVLGVEDEPWRSGTRRFRIRGAFEQLRRPQPDVGFRARQLRDRLLERTLARRQPAGGQRDKARRSSQRRSRPARLPCRPRPPTCSTDPATLRMRPSLRRAPDEGIGRCATLRPARPAPACRWRPPGRRPRRLRARGR